MSVASIELLTIARVALAMSASVRSRTTVGDTGIVHGKPFDPLFDPFDITRERTGDFGPPSRAKVPQVECAPGDGRVGRLAMGRGIGAECSKTFLFLGELGEVGMELVERMDARRSCEGTSERVFSCSTEPECSSRSGVMNMADDGAADVAVEWKTESESEGCVVLMFSVGLSDDADSLVSVPVNGGRSGKSV